MYMCIYVFLHVYTIYSAVQYSIFVLLHYVLRYSTVFLYTRCKRSIVYTMYIVYIRMSTP